MADDGRPAKRAKTDGDDPAGAAAPADAGAAAGPAAAGPAVDTPPVEQPWRWKYAADWLRAHNGGQWAEFADKFDTGNNGGQWKEFADKFKGLSGRQLCKLTEEQIKSEVLGLIGATIFNDIEELKRQATSSSSESSPGSASGPSEHASLWAALRGCERKQSTPVTLYDLEADRSRFVKQQTTLGGTIAELEVKIANAGVAAADDGAAGAAAGDLGDGAGAAAAAPAQEAAEDAVVVVTLPEGVGWVTENARHMFVRPCWVKLYDVVMGKMESRAGTKGEGIILTGNPGIGKSWFLSYVLYRVASEMPTRAVVFESVAEEKLWVFGADGSVRQLDWEQRRHVEELNDASTIYLFDPAGHNTGEPYRCLAFTIIASSPNKNNYRDMLKHGGKILYMPPWSLAELRTAAPFVPKPPSAQDVAERFAHHGGISRAVLSDDPELWDAQLQAAVESCNLGAVKRSLGHSDADESATHKVVAYKVIEDGHAPYTRVRVDFVSPHVGKLVFDQYHSAKRAELATFLLSAQGSPTVAGVCGALFEQLVHRTLVAGGTFKLRRLDGGAGPAHVRVVPLDTTTVRRVSGLSAIRAVADKPMYVQPEFGNFPVLDGLMLNATDGASLSRFVGVQSTVSLHHPLKQAPLLSIIQGLDMAESDFFDVIFVVWPSTFEEFKRQQYLTADGNVSQRVPALIQKAVRQWVLEVPLTEPAGSPPK
eukprot:CAMPEP_0206309780 /NCGR_PEP_ID=MMETSP0106_2-20121207/12575_1 /ASSEMBLY_ACC=CAM_ASM_000206 /TAXON_ID=81532 /ORGANISM="Acanthoeca-like sp., Strain 10tr" /LENGTH=707 /DNA_ID=CAMNT_0053740909 /DNA_START=118 /DNA_END=2242 /DNA_ORIENTATION=-